jgi:hypothetical protein
VFLTRSIIVSCFTLVTACSSAPPLAAPAAPLTPPTVLCTETASPRSCNRAEHVEAWLRDPRLEIVGSAPTPGGQQGAMVLTLALTDHSSHEVFRAKWRALDSESMTNDPRKELGAYAVQKLFLEPHEYVVPPTSGHCFALDHYRAKVDGKAPASFEEEGVRCVFGILSYWLEEAEDLEGAQEKGRWGKSGILDPELFRRDLGYRRSLADLNLLTYLVRHGDAHDKQFLITKERPSPRLYSVDNSITFQAIKNPMLLFREDWSLIRVPALSAQSVARLKQLGADDWSRLGLIEQYQKRDGQLVAAAHDPPIGPPDAGVRWVGLGLQIGLTESEIQGVRQRFVDLSNQIEAGKLRTF